MFEYVGKIEATYFSCPAVSHIDILTALPSTLIFLFRNDAYDVFSTVCGIKLQVDRFQFPIPIP